MTGAGATYLFDVLSGLIAEVTPTWFVLLLGSALNFGGYFMIWLAVSNRISKPKVCGSFSTHRPARSLLITWLPAAAISVVFVYTIRAMTVVRQPNELRIFYRFLCVSIFLALFLMGMTIAQNIVTFSARAYAGSASVVIFILFVPLFLAIKEELDLWKMSKQQPVTVPEVKIENMNQNHECVIHLVLPMCNTLTRPTRWFNRLARDSVARPGRWKNRVLKHWFFVVLYCFVKGFLPEKSFSFGLFNE